MLSDIRLVVLVRLLRYLLRKLQNMPQLDELTAALTGTQTNLDAIKTALPAALSPIDLAPAIAQAKALQVETAEIRQMVIPPAEEAAPAPVPAEV